MKLQCSAGMHLALPRLLTHSKAQGLQQAAVSWDGAPCLLCVPRKGWPVAGKGSEVGGSTPRA